MAGQRPKRTRGSKSSISGRGELRADRGSEEELVKMMEAARRTLETVVANLTGKNRLVILILLVQQILH